MVIFDCRIRTTRRRGPDCGLLTPGLFTESLSTLCEGEAVLVLLLAEGEGFFGEVEAFLGHVFAEGVHFLFVLELFVVEFGALFANFDAGGKIGQALECEELGGGVLT